MKTTKNLQGNIKEKLCDFGWDTGFIDTKPKVQSVKRQTSNCVVLFKMFKNLEVINAKIPDYIKKHTY